MFVVAPFQLKYSILFHVSDGTAFSYRLTDLLPTLPWLLPPSIAAAGVPQGMDGRQAAASGPGRAAGALRRGHWFWQLVGVRESRPCSLPQFSRGLTNKLGKPNQGSLLRPNLCRVRCARRSVPCPKENLKKLAGNVIAMSFGKWTLWQCGAARVGVLSDHRCAAFPGQVCSEHGALNHSHILQAAVLLHNFSYCVAEKPRGFNRFWKSCCVLRCMKKIPTPN